MAHSNSPRYANAGTIPDDSGIESSTCPINLFEQTNGAHHTIEHQIIISNDWVIARHALRM